MAVRRSINWAETGVLLVIVAVVYALWSTPVVYPLKMLVVFFHELSHGLMAVFTGGDIIRIELDHRQGGLCVTRGGVRFLVTSAGYLGSMLWGGVILVAAARTRFDRHIMFGLGLLLLLTGALWVRPFISFAFFFVLAMGAAMVAAGRYLDMRVNDLLLKLVGLTSCLYAIADIKSDALDRDIPSSDASKIAEYVPLLSGWMVGAVWIALSVLATLGFLWFAAAGGSDGADAGAEKAGARRDGLS